MCSSSRTIGLFSLFIIVVMSLGGFDVQRDVSGIPLRWPDRDIAVFLENQPHGDVNANVIAKQARAALETWNAIPATKIRLVWGGLVRGDPRFDIYIRFRSSGFKLRAGLPTASVRIDSENSLIERVAIELNAQHFRFATKESLLDNRIHADLRTNLIHHLGHALGLGLSRQADSMMFFLPRARRELTEDDRRGARFLYGPQDIVLDGGLCSPCSSDAQCDGRCLQWPDGRGYCASDCQTHQDCPIGFSCGTWSAGQACLPNDRHCAVQLAKAGASGKCANDLACPDPLFCLSTSKDAFCTAGCDGFCGNFGVCRQVNLANTAVGLCLKGMNRPFGTDCTVATQCTSLLCEPVLGGGGKCGRACATGCGEGNTCDAEGISCVIPGDRPVAWPCKSGFDCQSGLCIEYGKGFDRVCAIECTTAASCPEGTGCTPTQLGMYCLPYGPPPAGAPCAKVGACGQNMVCDIAKSDAAGRCAPKCDLLGDSTDCPVGDRCAWLSGDEGLCRASGAGQLLDQPCSAEQPCRVDLVCIGQDQQGTCRRLCSSKDTDICANQSCEKLAVNDDQMFVCASIDEFSERISALKELPDNFAAQNLLLQAVGPFKPLRVDETSGCSAQKQTDRNPWTWIAMLLFAAVLIGARKRTSRV
ncbi:MAG TPA: hypothetical protein DCQ06_13855 [Myxococcales bacterium]|nr:hypothetical protein [Myxococcales bacterium]HAN32675.1 hypothetical protein [Myxococcales bacterium]